ncbi:hypothetical protein Z052_01920 [Halorubrum sp. C191]|uniref:hypothetical protein n=1 Tax=Halorubrum sp. C191 TaxID=1383842 RepID=UPI000C069C2F|nr:hypothetical protein [Halorubrum sp. C191]PHQ43920.1 hypothetical protein Z052_01920 [Halorubrum sp. C191]
MSFSPNAAARVGEALLDDADTVVSPSELDAVADADDTTMTVSLGETAQTIDICAANIVVAGIDDPRSTFETIRGATSHSGDAISEAVGSRMVNAPVPVVEDGEYRAARTRGFVRGLAAIASMITDSRKNAVYAAVETLAQTSPQLNISTNPLRDVKEFYVVETPPRIEHEVETEVETIETTTSAASADW